MDSIFDQVAVRRQLTEHPVYAVYAAWTVFDLTIDALYYLFEDQIRALGQRCFDFQDHTLGILPRLGFLSPSSFDQGVKMCFYLRLLWMWAAGLVIFWLVPQDRRHGKICWLWSVPVTGILLQWGMLCLVCCRLFPCIITGCTDPV